VATRAEVDAGPDPAIVIPTLTLREQVTPVIETLTSIAEKAESISVLRPINAFWRLRKMRSKFAEQRVQATATLDFCHDCLKEPVEGGSAMDNAWLQSWSTATGTSLLLQLQSALQAASETLDRKAAYSLAVFSSYLALVSIVATCVFGVLTLL
jgi:hypothetical protein